MTESIKRRHDLLITPNLDRNVIDRHFISHGIWHQNFRSTKIANKRFRAVTRFMIRVLMGWRLHEVARRTVERTADSVIECQLHASHGVDHDAGGVGRVPHLKLYFALQGNVSKRRSVHVNVAPFLIGQPWYVIARSHVNVLRRHGFTKLTGDRIRFRYFL